MVIAGRVSDSSQFLVPIAHERGLRPGDWTRLAQGALVGRLLECSTQVTGGYFADPGFKDVPRLDNLGYPLAEVSADGSVAITKLDGTGGCVTPMTVKEQLLCEVHDTAAYLTPDVSADFTDVRIAQEAPDRVRVSGATGRPWPDRLKALVAFDGGFLAEGKFGYAGPGVADRARLAAGIVGRRMIERHGFGGELRLDLVEVSSLHATARTGQGASEDVRLRGAVAQSRPQMGRDIAEGDRKPVDGRTSGRRRVPGPVHAVGHHPARVRRPRPCRLRHLLGDDMSRLVQLRELAAARAGDKGDTSNVSIWVYDPTHYEAVRRALTADRVKACVSRPLPGQGHAP